MKTVNIFKGMYEGKNAEIIEIDDRNTLCSVEGNQLLISSDDVFEDNVDIEKMQLYLTKQKMKTSPEIINFLQSPITLKEVRYYRAYNYIWRDNDILCLKTIKDDKIDYSRFYIKNKQDKEAFYEEDKLRKFILVSSYRININLDDNVDFIELKIPYFPNYSSYLFYSHYIENQVYSFSGIIDPIDYIFFDLTWLDIQEKYKTWGNYINEIIGWIEQTIEDRHEIIEKI